MITGAPHRLGMAVVVPVLALCFLVAFDTVVYVTAWQRLNQAAASLGRAIGAAASLHEADFPAYFAQAQDLAGYSDVTRQGATTVTALYADSAGAPQVVWQRSLGTVRATRPDPTRLPPDLVLARGDTLIATELSAPVSPWVVGIQLLGGLVPTRLHGQAWERRNGTALTHVWP